MNKALWHLYKGSEQGKNVIARFTSDISNPHNLEFIAQRLYRTYVDYLGDTEGEEDFIMACHLVADGIFADRIFVNSGENASEYFNRLVDRLELCFFDRDKDELPVRVGNETPLLSRGDYKALCSIVAEISLVLYAFKAGGLFFFPILFKEQFDIFIKILDVLGIPMPALPGKADKKGRLLMYNEINRNIERFALENGLSPEETCACVYDFALMFLCDLSNDTTLPEPTNVWLTGGSKSDYELFLKNPKEALQSVWTCNERTKRGDIIVMYVRTPYSCIQSIWRADIDGVYTPFNYYNSRTRVVRGIVVPHINLNELKSDSYFSKFPLTRKNFQGVNGVHLSAVDYAELQRLFRNKGFDTSVLPQLYIPDVAADLSVESEKEVEDLLLIPLLRKLGFADADWTRQLIQKAGRKEKAIPDFVFLPKGETYFQNAPLIIEVKFDMGSNIERTRTYNQALSYARLLKSSSFAICDKDRIIVYKERKGTFNRFSPNFEKHWQNLNNADTFSELKSLIGRDAINS